MLSLLQINKRIKYQVNVLFGRNYFRSLFISCSINICYKCHKITQIIPYTISIASSNIDCIILDSPVLN